MIRKIIIISILILTCSVNSVGVNNILSEAPKGFWENKGQFKDYKNDPIPDLFFLFRAQGADVYITSKGISIVIGRSNQKDCEQSDTKELRSFDLYKYDLELANSFISKDNIEAIDKLDCTINFFPTNNEDPFYHLNYYKKIRIKNVYENIDWDIYANADGTSIKYDFVVHPGGDPNSIELRFKGGEEIIKDENGNIILSTLNNLVDNSPISYQGGKEVATSFVQMESSMQNDTINFAIIKFQLNSFDRNQDLIIDPTLTWATFWGGTSTDGPQAVKSDNNNNIYMTGYGEAFPLLNPFSGTYFWGSLLGNGYMFLSKYNALGALTWSTYYEGATCGNDIAIDNNNNIYIVADVNSAFSTQIPVGAYTQTFSGGGSPLNHEEIGVIKFNGSGVRLWATFFGGQYGDSGNGIEVDLLGNIYIVGATDSDDFPILSPGGVAYSQSTPGSFYAGGGWYGAEAFIAKFNSSLALVWSSYLGGANTDQLLDVDVDSQNNVFVIGKTSSANFPTQNPGGSAYFRSTFLVGSSNGGAAIICKFSSTSQLLWSTYFDGSTEGEGITIDINDNVLAVGKTFYGTLSLFNPGNGAYFQNTQSGSADLFILRFNNLGSLTWSTYFGGPGMGFLFSEETTIGRQGSFYGGNNITSDCNGNLYISGTTKESVPTISSPGCNDYFKSALVGASTGKDVFVLRFDTTAKYTWGTHIDGVYGDRFSRGICLNNLGDLFVTGENGTTTQTLSGAYNQSRTNVFDEGFLIKFSPTSFSITLSNNNSNSCASCNGDASVVVNCGSSPYNYAWSTGETTSSISGLCNGIYSVTVSDGSCNNSFKVGSYTLSSPGGGIINTSSSVSICSGQSVMIHGVSRSAAAVYTATLPAVGGCDSISTVSLTVNSASTNTISPFACSSYTHGVQTYTSSGVYTQTLTGASCDSILTINLTIGNPINTSSSVSICSGQSVMIHGVSRSAPAVYTATLPAVGGCDSISSVNLTVNAVSTNTISPFACSSYTHGVQTYTSSGVYTQTLTGASCDSILTINLTIGNPINTSSAVSICSGQSVMIHGVSRSAAAVYTATLPAVGGCDSISTVSLTVNSASTNTISPFACSSYIHGVQTYTSSGVYTQTLTGASCDSILTINLTIGNPINTSSSVSICSGQSVMIHGVSRSAPAVYTATLPAVGGCDSISSVNLTVNAVSTNTISPFACSSYTHGVQTYTSSGVYTQTLTGASCDSILTINLTIGNPINTSSAVSICSGQSVMIHGVSRSAAAVYTATLPAVGGCDSISTVSLTVNSASTNTISPFACSSYIHGVQTYTSSGVYTQTLTGASCDSILTINLTIGNPINTSSAVSICSGQSVMIHGVSRSLAAVYTATLPAVGGCDSISTVSLTVNSASTNTISPFACSSYTHGVQTYTSSGVYTQTLTGASCDSILTINLTIGNPINTSSSVSICPGQSVMIHGVSRSAPAVYTATLPAVSGCDSISTVSLTVNSASTNTISPFACSSYTHGVQTYTSSGVYTQTLSGASCDSILTINLTIGNPINTSSAVSICSGQSVMIHGVSRSAAAVYTATLPAVGGCDSISSVTLAVNLPPGVFIGRDTTLQAGETIVLSSTTTGIAYQWSTGQTSSSITVKPSVTTQYVLTITDINNCTASDTITVGISELCDDNTEIFVPNSFSPNGDGENDLLKLYTKGNPESIRFVIYNRWGQIVFETTDPNQAWDGWHKQKQCNTGVYVYLLKYNCKSLPNEIIKQGNISLMR